MPPKTQLSKSQSKKHAKKVRRAAQASKSGTFVGRANARLASNAVSDRNRTRIVGGMGVAQRRVQSLYGKKKLELAIALPNRANTCRLPTADMTSTALICVSDQFTVNSPTVTTTYNTFGQGDLLFALHGQIGRFLMLWCNVAAASTYTLYFTDPAAALIPSNRWQLFLNFSLAGTLVLNTPWTCVGGSWATGNTTHGRTVAIGQHNGNSYYFCNPGDTLSISCNSFGTLSGTFTLSVFRFMGPNDADQALGRVIIVLTAGSGSATYNIGTTIGTGYFRLEADGLEITAGAASGVFGLMALTMNVPAANQWRQLMVADVDSASGGDPIIAQESRVDAASLLITNTTSYNTRQGTVLAARLKGKNFTDVTPFDLQVAEKYSDAAEKGCYTFKAFTENCEKFEDGLSLNPYVAFNLGYEDYLHFIQVSCPQFATAANSYTVTYTAAIEFITTLQRYESRTARGTIQDLASARATINDVPEWFYENPMHMSDIYNFVKGAAKSAYGHYTRNKTAYDTLAGALTRLLV